MNPMRGVVAVAAAVLVLTGCSQTVSGKGSPGGPGSPGAGQPSGPSSPGQSGAPAPESPTSSSPAPPAAAHLACPHVVDPVAGLAYDCVVGAMTRGSNAMWPVKFEKAVDVQWTMDEGSGSVAGQSPAAVANGLSTTMARADYGPSPGVRKEADRDTTIDGKKAHLVLTVMTINPAYRKQRHLRVTQERLWMVAVQSGPNRVSAWYVSVPSVQKALWPRVPTLIKAIKVV